MYTNATGSVTVSHFQTSILSLWVLRLALQSLTSTLWSNSTGLQNEEQLLHTSTALCKNLGFLFTFSSSSSVQLQWRDFLWSLLLLWRGRIFKLFPKSSHEFPRTSNQPDLETLSTTFLGVTNVTPQGAELITWAKISLCSGKVYKI